MVVVGERYCGEWERELTVQKTSLFYPGDGFAAYDHSTGDLVFRVDTYGPSPHQRRGHGPSTCTLSADEIVLMDPSGASILTVRRKWPSLHQRWEGFLGERRQQPVFSVRRSSIIGRFAGDRGGVTVEVHGEAEYRVEGSFAQRCCTVVYEEGDQGVVVAAEIKRKVDTNVVLGRDVFSLCLKPRFDAAFAMALVLVLDQISGDIDDNIATSTQGEEEEEAAAAAGSECGVVSIHSVQP